MRALVSEGSKRKADDTSGQVVLVLPWLRSTKVVYEKIERCRSCEPWARKTEPLPSIRGVRKASASAPGPDKGASSVRSIISTSTNEASERCPSIGRLPVPPVDRALAPAGGTERTLEGAGRLVGGKERWTFEGRLRVDIIAPPGGRSFRRPTSISARPGGYLLQLRRWHRRLYR